MYSWFVFAHLVGLVLFVFAHGASAFATYQIRTMRDPATVSGYLEMSSLGTKAATVGLVVLLIGGAGAASVGDLWSWTWVWSSIIVLIVVVVLMLVLSGTYYYRLRDLLAGKGGAPPIEEEALVAYLDSRRPDVIAVIGVVGFLVLIWLMVMKPT